MSKFFGQEVVPCLKVYFSSAGSGKTHTLTREYIRLALGDPFSPRYFSHIIAITFTNKATEEMRSRILEHLYALSQGQAVYGSTEAELFSLFQMPAERLRYRAGEVLKHVLHNYGQFAISTIDVFFQRLVRAFLLEIGVPGYYHLEVDTGPALQAAAEALLKQAGSNKALTHWLITFIERQLQEEKSWHPSRRLLEFAPELFKEQCLRVTRSSPAQEPLTQDEVSHFLESIDKEKKPYEQKLQKQAEKARSFLQQHGLGVEDFSYKKNGALSIFMKIDRRKFLKKELLTQRFRQAAEDNNIDHTRASGSSNQKDQVVVCLREGLQACLQDTLSIIEKEGRYYETLSAAQEHLYLLGIVSHMQQVLRDYRDTQGIFFLSDVNEILRQLTAESHTPYLYEKVGTYYNHYLLDEFQDTSLFQGESLQPLLAEGVAQGYTQLLVGDRKQSIYRWRGAAPADLFKSLTQNISDEAFQYHHLDKNWRSAEALVTFNNALFTQAAQLLSASQPKEEAVKEVNSPLSDYARAAQTSAHPQEQGYLTFTGFCDTENKAALENRCLNWLSTQVETLFQRGYRPKDICILVRRHEESRKVVQTLLKHAHTQDKPYGIYSQESLLLAGSSSVQLLCCAFALLNEQEIPPQAENTPTNMPLSAGMPYVKDESTAEDERKRSSHTKILWIQLYELHQKLQEPYWQPTHEAYEAFWQQIKTHPRGAIAHFKRRMSMLRKLPLYILSEQLISIFELQKYREEQPFLHDFQSLVFYYQRKEGQSLTAFLLHWEDVCTQASLSAPSTTEAIQVMTLHKAKGLEFPVVLLPFCMWDLDHSTRHAPYLWEESPQEGFFAQFPFLLLRYSSKLLDTAFATSYQKERRATYVDNLNLLYVACTRAMKELHVCYGIKESKTKKEAFSHVGELLQKLLFDKDTQLLPNLERRISEEKDRYVCYYGKKEKTTPQRPMPDELPLPTDYEADMLLDRPDWSHYIFINTPIQETIEARKQGILLHALIAQINHINELPSILDRLKKSPQEEIVADRLRALFALPEMKDWFSGTWELRHEQNILTPAAECYRPDLVLLRTSEVHVVDFKTSPAQKAQHIQQLAKYINLVTQLSTSSISGFLAYAHPAHISKIK